MYCRKLIAFVSSFLAMYLFIKLICRCIRLLLLSLLFLLSSAAEKQHAHIQTYKSDTFFLLPKTKSHVYSQWFRHSIVVSVFLCFLLLLFWLFFLLNKNILFLNKKEEINKPFKRIRDSNVMS